ncbi:MAG: hypothetical protein HOH43_10150 [Candidatus Latescibacteria bacterium]|nr:hypothetical protein [Candidatus Latescibacterota bacterium]
MRSALFAISLSLVLFITEVRAQSVPIIDTIAGVGEDYPGDGGPATQAQLSGPVNVHVGSDATIYIVDWSDDVIRTVSPEGTISLFAGDYSAGFLGDDGPATLAQLNSPTDIVDDGAGNLYIADGGNNRIRKVDAFGTITTVAGTGIVGHSGDGGPATLAMMDNPSGLAFDSSGSLFIADYGNHVIRKIDTNGVITTVAGTPTVSGFSGDDGPATQALMEYPTALATDTEGGIYFTEESNHTIRKIATNGTLVRIAGTGSAGFSGDNGPATQAYLSLWWPTGLDVDHLGNVFVTDTFNHRVRRVNTDGFISTVAGTGTPGYDGDGGPATLASIDDPMGLDVDNEGNIYFPEWSNSTVRKVSALPSTDVQLHFSESFGGPGDLATVNLTVTSGIPIGGLEFTILPELQFSESNAPLTPGPQPVVLEGIINDLENEGVSVFHSTDPSTAITTIIVVSINGSDIGPGDPQVLELVYRIDEQIAPAARVHIQVNDVLVSSTEATVLTHSTFPGFIHPDSYRWAEVAILPAATIVVVMARSTSWISSD